MQLEEIIRQLQPLDETAMISARAHQDTLTKHRGRGVGRILIARAKEWAKTNRFPGITLETQNNNVAACLLYESSGFELRGFDTHLYKGLNPATEEIALFWYLIF